MFSVRMFHVEHDQGSVLAPWQIQDLRNALKPCGVIVTHQDIRLRCKTVGKNLIRSNRSRDHPIVIGAAVLSPLRQDINISETGTSLA